MKVWVVRDGDWDGDWIVGVFSNEESARACQSHGNLFDPEPCEVLDTFVPPTPQPEPDPLPSRQCNFVVYFTHEGGVITTQCTLPKGHDGAHDVPTVQLTEI